MSNQGPIPGIRATGACHWPGVSRPLKAASGSRPAHLPWRGNMEASAGSLRPASLSPGAFRSASVDCIVLCRPAQGAGPTISTSCRALKPAVTQDLSASLASVSRNGPRPSQIWCVSSSVKQRQDSDHETDTEALVARFRFKPSISRRAWHPNCILQSRTQIATGSAAALFWHILPGSIGSQSQLHP